MNYIIINLAVLFSLILRKTQKLKKNQCHIFLARLLPNPMWIVITNNNNQSARAGRKQNWECPTQRWQGWNTVSKGPDTVEHSAFSECLGENQNRGNCQIDKSPIISPDCRDSLEIKPVSVCHPSVCVCTSTLYNLS